MRDCCCYCLLFTVAVTDLGSIPGIKLEALYQGAAGEVWHIVWLRDGVCGGGPSTWETPFCWQYPPPHPSNHSGQYRAERKWLFHFCKNFYAVVRKIIREYSKAPSFASTLSKTTWVHNSCHLLIHLWWRLCRRFSTLADYFSVSAFHLSPHLYLIWNALCVLLKYAEWMKYNSVPSSINKINKKPSILISHLRYSRMRSLIDKPTMKTIKCFCSRMPLFLHLFLLFTIDTLSYIIHSFIHLHTFTAVGSVGGISMGCRAEIRTRACFTAHYQLSHAAP